MSKTTWKYSFSAGSFYYTLDPIAKHDVFAYVTDVHPSGRAVFALIFDHTWGFVSFRWCRVFIHDQFFAGRLVFDAKNVLKDSSCIPPEDVLNFLASRA